MDDDIDLFDTDDDDEDLIQSIDAMPSQHAMPESSESDSCTGIPSLKTNEISLNVFKHGRKGLSVTNIVNQFWCEQQFEYGFTRPVTKPIPAIVSAGSKIHMERELEVHDLIPVVCHTKEDAWALKLLNCYQQLNLLSQGSTIRELPIFGSLYDEDIFVQGIIDEIRCNSDGLLEIKELKTRSIKSMPSNAQHKKNALQVSIYRKLLDDLLVKKNGLDIIRKHVSLDWQRQISQDVVEYAEELGYHCSTFEETVNILTSFLEVYNFPRFAPSVIEYCYQNDKQTIGYETCEYDELGLKETLFGQYEYLLGKRQAKGVDIEEAWKCNSCDYANVCCWRKNQEIIFQNKNALNFKP